jgi:hypothetical protein
MAHEQIFVTLFIHIEVFLTNERQIMTRIEGAWELDAEGNIST